MPFLPEFVEVLERHDRLHLPYETRERLLSISAATVDRLLAAKRRADRVRGKRTTLPGSLLKHHVPIRTFSDWDDLRPGFLEADLVAHCGTSTAGSYVHTLTMTDVSTGWTECLAVPYRDQEAVLHALRTGRERLPFPLLGLDTDNGSEFLNYALLDYCTREEITFTRSRAYKKNDQCHVEQKNGSIVRRFVGYERFEGLDPCRLLSELYAVLRLYVNFFQPSMKLVSKRRDGARVIKKYDVAKTPYQRVLASDQVSEEVKQRLRQHYLQLDPVALLMEIEALQDQLWSYAYVPARGLDEHEQLGTSVGTPPAATTIRAPATAKSIALTTSSLGGDGASAPAVVALPGVGFSCKRHNRAYRKTKRKGRYHLVKHTWRTRADPFAEVKAEIEQALKRHPVLEAKTLLRDLQSKYPGRFSNGQLRTLQRRVKAWRLAQSMAIAEEIGLIIDTGATGSNGSSG